MKNGLINRFFDFVELRTKITSVFAFLFMLGYGLLLNAEFNIQLLTCYFVSMFLFDLCTTAINNMIGYKQGTNELSFSYKTGFWIVLVLFVLATVLGLILAANTGIIVLLFGGLCFLFGILYTLGPLPISALPFGEITSGIFYGFFIPFIGLSFMMPKGYFLAIDFVNFNLNIMVNIPNIFMLLLFCTAPILTTSSIMLANNTCDLEQDIGVGRHTLVYYIGKKRALILFVGSYITIYITYLILFFIGKIDLIAIIVLAISLYPVTRNIRTYLQKQIKSETFIISVKNYVVIMVSIVIGLFGTYLI